MAKEAALSICKFNNSQIQEFRNLDERIKRKWRIQHRWDSKVPENDKWLFYFFTFRGLNVEEISNTIKKLEKDFDAINEDMKKIREGKNVTREKIESIRKRFEKVLGEIQTINKSTDSSSLYSATGNILANKDDVLKSFDHLEIVQSRRELPVKKRQLDELKRLNENKDQTILTMSKLYDDYVQKDIENDETIDILENQSRVSKENADEYKDLTNELMRKINPMLLGCNGETENGKNIHTAIEINLQMVNAVFNLFNASEDTKDKEWEYEKELANLENKLKINSLKTLQTILKLKKLIENMISDTNDDRRTDINENGMASQEYNSNDVSGLLQKSNEERKELLKHHLTVVLERSKEFRGESKELMKLMNSMFPDTSDLNKTVVPVLETVVEINECMKDKLNATHELFEDFSEREIKRDVKIKNLADQFSVKFEQILEEIHKIIELLNTPAGAI